MLKTFVLIWMLSYGNAGGSGSAEFLGEPSCLNAKAQIERTVRGASVIAFCVPKYMGKE